MPDVAQPFAAVILTRKFASVKSSRTQVWPVHGVSTAVVGIV